MGKKAQTFQQRLVAWAITASDDELALATDTLKAFVAANNPKPKRATKKRKPAEEVKQPD